jgi:hypothetical protein
LVTIKHAQAQQLWPNLTTDYLENFVLSNETSEFVDSMVDRELIGQLYVWVNQDETKFSLTFNPQKQQSR